MRIIEILTESEEGKILGSHEEFPETDEPLVGPHNKYLNHELDLLLAGKKPIALLGMTDEVKSLVDNGTLVAKRSNAHNDGTCFVTLPGQEHRIKPLDKAWTDLFHAQDNNDMENTVKGHIAVGLQLGYPKESVKYFITSRYPEYAKLAANL